MAAGLRLSLLDGCHAEISDGSNLGLKNKKSLAILGYLSTCETFSASRSRLCGLFWSEVEESKARTSLRQSLKLINKALMEGGLTTLFSDKDQIHIKKSEVSQDLHDLWEAISSRNFSFPSLLRERLPERIFLGFEDLDPAFDAWLAIFREEFRQNLLTRLETSFQDNKDPQIRLWVARAIVKAEPTDEAMVRFIMATEATQGRKHLALREYNSLLQTLRHEFEVDVEPETRKLAEEIESNQTRIQMGSEPALDRRLLDWESEQEPVIAVMVTPSKGNKSEKLEALSSVFQSSLISGLVRFRHWTIVDRASLHLTGGEMPDSSITHELRILLTPSSNKLNVAIELKENAYLQHVIWADAVTMNLAGWEEKITEVVKGLCSAFNIHLSRYHLELVRKGQKVAPQAFEKLVEGQTLLQLWSPEADERAEALFLEAIQVSPDNAELHARLADIYNSRHIIYPGTERSRALELRSLQLAKRAVMLDPLSAKCHLTLAWSQAMAKKPVQALHSFQTSVDLNDADPENLISAAHGAAICGDESLAARCRDMAFSVHPCPPNLYWGFDSNIRFQSKEYEESVFSADRSGEIKPNILGWKSAALGMLGRSAEATQTGEEFITMVRQGWVGTKAPSPEHVVEWFVQIFPFSRDSQKQHLLEGLFRAGLPSKHLNIQHSNVHLQ
ncbi:BTAD domain-containing putative transcriptional regulator [Roseibium sp.]